VETQALNFLFTKITTSIMEVVYMIKYNRVQYNKVTQTTVNKKGEKKTVNKKSEKKEERPGKNTFTGNVTETHEEIID
jgi:hypothetical protein